jgi:hypothetical protein
MCPACLSLTTIALLSAGSATTGGLAALAATKLNTLLRTRRLATGVAR